MKTTACWLSMLLLLSACGDDNEPMMCQNVEPCVFYAIKGLCLSDGMGRMYCAERFDACPTGYRWDRSAAPELANKCVRPEYLADMSIQPHDAGADAPGG